MAAGSLAKTRRKRSTGRFEWTEARAVADRWEATGRWPDATAPAPDPGESVEDQSKIMIDQAIRCYLAEHKHDAENTLKRYGYIMDKVRAYSEHKGFRFVEQ
jgi:hypothetical protein